MATGAGKGSGRSPILMPQLLFLICAVLRGFYYKHRVIKQSSPSVWRLLQELWY
ncbi:hypothetical protein BDF20DRAFT_489258 [Mycotypha africana]|uniref:uncharacterized protein n=1 Tax=Mycotypha africana TaxID=64632 RepID=UPI00230139CA|nr:uncharacterized protein BDF20DRAFT_489258 [Mycotypha africana]KAI8979233.1 hypothetical protein BDF20DRAFT_489258 [Mycotypha africana]